MSNLATGHGCILTTTLQKMVTVDKIFAYLDTHVDPQKLLFGEEYLFSSQNFPDFFRLNMVNNYPIQFATYNCQNYHNDKKKLL